MLPFPNRLKKREDFEAVYKKGKNAFFSGLFLRFMKNGQKETRIGFAIGLKFSKRAVIRNQVKRRLREIFRKELSQIKPGYDIIVSLTHSEEKEGWPFEKLADWAKKALKKANLNHN